MLRCPELSKLPKAPIFSSINFKRQTPGSPSPLLKVGSVHEARLDHSHPAVALGRDAFPKFRHNAFELRAYPISTLGKPALLWPEPLRRSFDTWEDRIQRARDAQKLKPPGSETSPVISEAILSNERPGSVSMSFMVATSKKRTSSKRVIRHAITKKVKEALTLIVARGADVERVNKRRKIVFKQEEATQADDWVLRGWSYIFFPTIELYMMPYYDLIPLLRLALRGVRRHGRLLDAKWEAQIPRRLVSKDRSPHSRQPRSDTWGLEGRENTNVSKSMKHSPTKIDNWQLAREQTELLNRRSNSNQWRPSNTRAHSPPTAAREQPESRHYRSNPTQSWAGNRQDRFSLASEDTRFEPRNQSFKSTRSWSESWREPALRTSVEMETPSKPQRLLTPDKVEKASVNFFKKLSQKDATPTRQWSLRPEKDTSEVIVATIRKVAKDFEREGKEVRPPSASKGPSQSSPRKMDPPDRRIKKDLSDSRKDGIPRSTAEVPRKDKDREAQIQDIIKNRLFKPNPIVRLPARPKR